MDIGVTLEISPGPARRRRLPRKSGAGATPGYSAGATARRSAPARIRAMTAAMSAGLDAEVVPFGIFDADAEAERWI
ncbi:hypothetical protein GCM10027187_74780 [Streptosporangium sandarakinum]